MSVYEDEEVGYGFGEGEGGGEECPGVRVSVEDYDEAGGGRACMLVRESYSCYNVYVIILYLQRRQRNDLYHLYHP